MRMFFHIIFLVLFFTLVLCGVEMFLIFGKTNKTIAVLNAQSFGELSYRLKNITEVVGSVPIRGSSKSDIKEWYSVYKKIQLLDTTDSYLIKVSRRLSILKLLIALYILIFVGGFVSLIVFLLLL